MRVSARSIAGHVLFFAVASANAVDDPLPVSPPIKVLRYVEHLIEKYDADADGQLQPQEWQSMQGNPAAIDSDNDGTITRQELADHVARYGHRRRIRLSPAVVDQFDLPSFLNPGNRLQPDEAATTAGALPAPDRPSSEGESDAPRRFSASNTRMPSGLPQWFAERDRDGDGQLTLAEFIADGPASAMDEFAGYDRNGDGVLTAAEFIRGPADTPEVVEPPDTGDEPEPPAEAEAAEVPPQAGAASATPAPITPASEPRAIAGRSGSSKAKLTAEEKAAIRKARLDRVRKKK